MNFKAGLLLMHGLSKGIELAQLGCMSHRQAVTQRGLCGEAHLLLQVFLKTCFCSHLS